MKGSFIVVAFFGVGCLAGWILNTQGITIGEDIPRYVLYLLMLQVGLNIGSSVGISSTLRYIQPQMLLIPFATIVGTLLFSALAACFISNWTLFDCLAVNSGFGYYSLSSVLITELKASSLGVQLATELGTIALMANIIREILTLLGAPVLVRYFGPLAPICAGGATTMDTTMPIIAEYSGRDLIYVALIHGVIVDLSVPFLVTFFCTK